MKSSLSLFPTLLLGCAIGLPALPGQIDPPPARRPVAIDLITPARSAPSIERLHLPPGPPPPAAWVGLNRVIGSGNSTMQLQWIAPGTFKMGDAIVGPITTVHITRGFWMGRYEVTQAQWTAIMGSNPSQFTYVGLNNRVEDAPVENVSWNDAVAFCRRINRREEAAGHLPPGYAYRLPTEAEREYACRAGTTGDYAGDGILDDMGWHYGWDDGNADYHPHPVGQKQPNSWALYDMHGNINDWCVDWFAPYPGGEVSDPVGPKTGVDRVIRGGSWQNMPEDCRSAFRDSIEPDNRVFNVGLRIVLGPQLP